jgi:hypothetical protein
LKKPAATLRGLIRGSGQIHESDHEVQSSRIASRDPCSLPSYTILGIVLRLAIHRDAADDLQAIKVRGDLADHGLILAFLRQAKSDPALLETLSENWFGEDGTADYSVRRIVVPHRQGRRLWRVKILNLKGLACAYRVIYAFNRKQDEVLVLGIPPREIAYDQSHPRIQRLLALYDSLGIS